MKVLFDNDKLNTYIESSWSYIFFIINLNSEYGSWILVLPLSIKAYLITGRSFFNYAVYSSS